VSGSVRAHQQHPFPYSYGTLNDYKRNYRLGFGLVVAGDPEKLLDPEREPKTVYEAAVSTIWRRQLRFLSWYYAFTVLEAVLFGSLANQYGNWWGRSRAYDWLARKRLLPKISGWQLLLTDFAFPKTPKREVQADVLCDGTLYRGTVGDYFLDISGDLSGMLLKNAERFRRKEFEAACEKANGAKIKRDEFWRKIPGSNFYVPAGKISNLNVRFPQLAEDFQIFINELLNDLDAPTGTTATFEASGPSATQTIEPGNAKGSTSDPIYPPNEQGV
jgi:hypothetical protein